MLKQIKKYLPLVVIILVSVFSVYSIQDRFNQGAPPYGESEEEIPEFGSPEWVRNWKRPHGPPKVGLQVGHFKNSELPEELEKLIGSTGTRGGGKMEWEVNLNIAERTADILRQNGIEVDILPATVPPSYWADVFLAIHADGNLNPTLSGFKVAAPWRDYSQKAKDLVSALEKSYEEATVLEKDPVITRNMRGYYAFSWWRYEHAVHPMTTSAIIETGFLTSPSDRRLLLGTPQISAEAIAEGIISHLTDRGILIEI